MVDQFNNYISSSFVDKEIKTTIFKLGSTKDLGPYGFSRY